jgi:hypothetical protein
MRSIKKLGIAGIAGAVASAAALAVSVLPAQAATPGWRQVFSQHYGAKADYSGFTSALAFGKNNAWVLGGTDLSGGNNTTQQPLILQWRGSGWTGNQAPTGVKGYVQSASADSASDIWAVTFENGDVLHYNGKKWSVAERLPNGSSGVLTDVVAISPKNVWAFGNTGFGPGLGTWHFDGTTWRHETTAALGDNIGEASAVSASNIWGSGASTAPSDEIEHFNGKSWSRVNSPVFTGLSSFGINAISASNVWGTAEANGRTFRSYLLHYSDHWSKVLVPWGLEANSGLTSDGGGGLWFTGLDSTRHEYVVHWLPGNKWQRTELSARVDTPAHIPGTTSMIASGNKVSNQNAVIWAYGSI